MLLVTLLVFKIFISFPQQVPVCETTEEPEVPMATAAMTTDSPDTHKATLQQGLLTGKYTAA